MKTLFADKIELHVDLEPLARLLQMRESCLPLSTYRHKSTRNAHIDAIGVQLLAGEVGILGNNFRNGMRELKFPRIALLSQRLDLLQLLATELILTFFE